MDDLNDENIHFDADGICNYCKDFLEKKDKYVFSKEEEINNLELIKKKKFLKLKMVNTILLLV